MLGRRENDEKRKKLDKAEKPDKPSDKTEKLPVVNAELPARLVVPPLTTAALWDTVTQVVKEEYNFVLGKEERTTISRLALLRSLCLKVGLQVAARDYDWAVEHPFSPTDVLDLFPIARTLLPRSTDGSILLEEGRLCLTMGTIPQCHAIALY